ncbi:hypothetical protein BV898_07492 [Hypsibius exemplaris]|uniref:Gustatory receptor n=1 Tax=Hypsibius exemplaris TaxID=2072580 RepID=A0A1W0WTL2_HYPEX|nr:hypothetical protein BV898_07492 [Hypsibius exemplaris]
MTTSSPILAQFFCLKHVCGLTLLSEFEPEKAKVPIWQRIFLAIRRAIFLAVVLACLAFALLQISSTVWTLISRDSARSSSLFVQLFADLPFFLYSIRAVLVMTVLVVNHSRFAKLHADIVSYVDRFFPERVKLLRKLKALSIVLFLATLTLHVGWQIFNTHEAHLTFSLHGDWTPSPTSNKTHETKIEISGYTKGFFKAFTVSLSEFDMLCLWVPIVDGTFIMSQQVVMCAGIFAVVLSTGQGLVNRSIKNFSTRMGTAGNNVADAEMNDCFGWILFVSLGMDFMSALGQGARLLASRTRMTAGSNGFYVGSCLLFLSYATVFLLPLMSMSEKGKETDELLNGLIWATEDQVLAPEDALSNTRKITSTRDVALVATHTQRGCCLEELKKLSKICRRQELVFVSGGLIRCTRSTIVSTATLAMSLLVLAKEFL